jgi:hypothetical protein
VVTSGEFTQEARSFTQGREIQLIYGKTLQRGTQAQAVASGSPVPVPREMGNSQPVLQPSSQRQSVLSAARRWCCDRLARVRRRESGSGVSLALN